MSLQSHILEPGEVKAGPLFQALAAVAGSGSVWADPDLSIDGNRPALLVKPADRDVVRDCMRVCSERRAAMIIAGAMSWMECGDPLGAADVVISLSRLDQLIEYSPADLTITAGAGMPLAELARITREHNQFLPLDPPASQLGTLGGLAATASSGPLRYGFGAPRDYVLGLSVVHADGTPSKSGGRVPKNVAGYDLNKLYVGSYGTLAAITEMTLKLRPRPERSSTAAAPGLAARTALDLAAEIRKSRMRPASLFVVNRALAGELGLHGEAALLARFLDTGAAVASQIDSLGALASRFDCNARLIADSHDGNDAAEEERKIWETVANLETRGATALKLSLLPAAAGSVFIDLATQHRASRSGQEHSDRQGLNSLDPPGAVVSLDAGLGLLRMGFNADDASTVARVRALRQIAESNGGSLVIEQSSPRVRSEAGVWGSIGPAALMRSIKDKFDPQGLLGPGRFRI